MEDLTAILLKRRIATMIFVIIFFAVGLVAISQVPISFYPRTSKPTVRISVSASGFSAEDLFDLYSSKLDSVAKQIDVAEKISAEFYNNRISYIFEFPWGYDLEEARNKVFAIAPRVEAIFPDDAAGSFGSPTVSGGNDGSAGFMSVALYSSELSHQELYLEAREILTSRFIDQVRDADSINISPVQILRADITFDPSAMVGLGLNPTSVIDKVGNRFQNQAMGNFNHVGRANTLRYLADAESVFDIGSIVVATINRTDIRLTDIADVNVRYDLPWSIYRANGDQAVFIVATPIQDGNIRTMALDIKNVLTESLEQFSKPVSFEIFVDPAEFIDDAILNVISAALQGGILTILVTLLLLGIPKNSLIVISAIPVSTVYAFIFIRLFDVSINLISLSGLAISVGMAIDASIVIMENIHRHRMESLKNNDGRTIFAILVQSIKEVRLSVIAGIFTSICVFLPLSFTAPLANAILGDLSFTVVFMLLSSLIVAYTLVPIIAYYLFRGDHGYKAPESAKKRRRPKAEALNRYFVAFGKKLELFSERLMAKLTAIYTQAMYKLLASMKMRLIFIGATIVLFLLSIFVILRQIPSEIMPAPASNKIYIYASNSSLNSENASDLLEAFEPVEEQILTIVGDKLVNRFFQTRGSANGSLLITIRSSRDTVALIDRLNDELSAEDWSFSISQWDPASMPLPTTWDFQLRISGPDRLQLVFYMEQIADVILRSKLYNQVSTSPSTTTTNQMTMRAKGQVINETGISDSYLTNYARIYLSGSTLTLSEGDENITANFRYPRVNTSDEVQNILIPYQGIGLPLSTFFDANFQEGISRIHLQQQQETWRVRARLAADLKAGNREINNRANQVKKMIEEQIDFAPGYFITYENGRAEIDGALASLMGALGLSITFIFLVLAVQFNSYKIPLIIASAIPFAIIGSLFSLYIGSMLPFIKSSTLSINSLLGMILLSGTAINNSILIVDFYLNYEHISDKTEAIINASALRLAPILTSALTTILGMVPIALAIGDGSNVIQALGITVSGGLAVSTFFTLFMIPTILSLTARPKRESDI
jgi:HAE1 family hydrophobic/amphiphilic exporter-1